MDADAENLDDLQSTVLGRTLAQVKSLHATSSDKDQPADSCCVICLDAISDVCEARPCLHRHFDYLCLLSWLEQQPKCPLCKAEVKHVAHGFRDCDKESSEVKLYTVPPPKKPAATQSQPRHFEPHRPHHRRRRQWIPSPSVTEDEAIAHRRKVYRDQLYSLHLGSNRRTAQYRTYRELTPQVFESDPALVSRARAWLRREFQVFEYLRAQSTNAPESSSDATARRRANNAEFLLEYVIAILKTVDMQGSQGQAEEMLKDFLGRDNAKLLLHELRNFLQHNSSIEAWDREVQYPQPRKRRNSNEHGGRAPASQRRIQYNSAPGHNRMDILDSYRPTYSDRSSRRVSEATLRYRPD